MGSPKAMLEFRGRSFLETILDATQAVGFAPRVVVLGHDADKLLASNSLNGVTSVRSEHLEAGPIASIRAGIHEILNQAVEAALVWHVDQPHVHVDTVGALVDRLRSDHPPIVLPVYHGRHGHPVLFARSVFEELLKAPDTEGARAVIHRDPARLGKVEVSDPAVLEDVNTPEAYRALLKRVDSTRE